MTLVFYSLICRCGVRELARDEGVFKSMLNEFFQNIGHSTVYKKNRPCLVCRESIYLSKDREEE